MFKKPYLLHQKIKSKIIFLKSSLSSIRYSWLKRFKQRNNDGKLVCTQTIFTEYRLFKTSLNVLILLAIYSSIDS